MLCAAARWLSETWYLEWMQVDGCQAAGCWSSKPTRSVFGLQVLLSEEVTGSLRKLRPTATLTRDRFKSLQRRGIIEPRVAVKGKKKPRRVSYTQGDRAEKAEAGMNEISALHNKRKEQ